MHSTPKLRLNTFILRPTIDSEESIGNFIWIRKKKKIIESHFDSKISTELCFSFIEQIIKYKFVTRINKQIHCKISEFWFYELRMNVYLHLHDKIYQQEKKKKKGIDLLHIGKTKFEYERDSENNGVATCTSY